MPKSVRLTEKTDIQDAVIPKRKRGKVQATMPEEAAYNVFGPQLAAVLTASSGGALGESARIGDRIALQNKARDERERYREDIAAANVVQRQLLADEAYYGLLEDVGQRGPQYMDRGVHGIENVERDENGQPIIRYDPVRQVKGNQNALNNDQSERLARQAGAVSELAGAGYGIPFEDVGKLITPPGQAEPMRVEPYMTPSDATQRYSADEGMTVEEQFALEELKAAARAADADEGVLTLNHGATGEVPTLTYKGSPEQIAAAKQRMIEQGFDPNTGERLNPRAGVRGGGTPATKAANNNNNIGPISSNPHRFYQMNITSKKGHRKDPITGKRKYHAGEDRGGRRGEPLPAEGTGTVIFSGQRRGYGNTVEIRYDDGSVVRYAHNSRNLVKVGQRVNRGNAFAKMGKTGRATGVHVHREVIKEGKPQNKTAVYASRLRAHPKVAQVQDAGDGRLLVTMKNGKRFVAQNGKMIGQ